MSIFAPTLDSLEKAKEMVLYYDQKPDIGRNYVGKVTKVIDCGCVVEIMPGLDGLVHVSQLDVERVENVADVIKLGQDLEVKVIEVESSGRVRLSRKAVIMEERGETIDLADFAKTGGGGRPRPGGGGGRDRDRRGGGGGRR